MAEQTLYYGGQALIEGVMIRGPHNVAVACRRPDGEIAVRREALGGLYSGALRRIPFLRGVIVLWETLALGMRALLFSSNVAMGEEEKEISRPFRRRHGADGARPRRRPLLRRTGAPGGLARGA